MALPALVAKLPVMHILTAMTGYTVFRGFQFSFRFSSMTVIATGLLMGPIDLEAGLFVVIEQPVLP